MYLKGLEINGFKSFPTRVNIEFTRGIIGIVGPNGSGKSNILDAVLWVLGEQSYKSIRAKESADVIFSGGKNRKARSSAEVSLIIDNSDSYFENYPDEVVITRSINRSSENTYSINGTKVRLKDINNLFMDTGIGKQAYSVIGQGKVERIISSSSQELRNIIDEAAGIKKAKTEKEISLKKLDSVENEIEKIEYVENDIKERLNNLEKQSKNARIYQAYTREIDINRYMVLEYKIESLKKENEKTVEEIKNQEEELLDKKIILDKLIIDINKNNQRKEEINKIIEKLVEDNSDNDIKLSDYKDEENSLIQQKSNFETLTESNKLKLKDLIRDRDSIHNNLVDLDKKYKDIDSKYTEIKKLFDENKLEEERKEKRKFELIEKIENLEKENRNLEVDKIKQNTSIDDAQRRIENAIKRNERILKEKEETLSKVEKIELKTDLSLEEITKLLKESIASRKSLNAKKEGLIAREQGLKNNLDNLKNYSNAIQYISKISKEDKDVIGTLISKIDIDKKYQLAVSILASYSFNDVIVKDNKVANKYIKELKDKKIGTVSFLPIVNLKNKVLIKDNNLLFARDIVKNIDNNPLVSKAIEHIFSNAIIVDKIEDGIKLKDFRDRIVSLEGDIISASGRITGGYVSKKIDDTLIKREELKSINKDIQKIELDLVDINNNIKVYEDLKDNVEHYSESNKKLQKEIDTYDFEINDNEIVIGNLKENIKNSKYSVNIIDENIASNKKQSEEYQKELSNLNTSENDENNINNLRVELAVLEEKRSNAKKLLDSKEIEYNEHILKIKEIEDFLNNKEEKYSNLDRDISKIKEKITNLLSENKDYKEELSRLNKENHKLNLEYNEKVDDKNKLDIDINNINNKIERLTDKNKRNTNELNIASENFEEFITREDEIKSYETYSKIDNDVTMKLSEKKISINEKNRLSLGEVNVSSIKEYEEESLRYEKLVNDKLDLIRSKDSILELIKNIDEDIITKFNYAFDEISKNFNYLCKELLQGASGSIKISKEDDLINTGLELSVKYKNKPAQSLTLLSGGEKSMLAVSFIMAIFMFKPSPFTFFDEVEAALDEQNTKKLISLLKRFENSQFILITHNKETMRGADKLYGVTMKKNIGESLIVSVEI